MAGPLIERADLEARLGYTLTGGMATQADALIVDASAEVRSHADGLLDEVEAPDTPDLIKTVVVRVVRRALFNPNGLTSEAIDGHQWAATDRTAVFCTPDEIARIRRAVGLVSKFASVGMEGYLPLHIRHFDDHDVINAIETME